MSGLKAKIKSQVTEAMKARNSTRTTSLRGILATIQKKEIELKKDELDDGEIEKVLLTLSKQIQETIDQSKTAGRADLVEAAETELAVVREFLPQQMSEADVEKAVAAIVAELRSAGTLPAGGAAMGAVMKQAMAKIGSRAEGKVVQAAVKKSLA